SDKPTTTSSPEPHDTLAKSSSPMAITVREVCPAQKLCVIGDITQEVNFLKSSSQRARAVFHDVPGIWRGILANQKRLQAQQPDDFRGAVNIVIEFLLFIAALW